MPHPHGTQYQSRPFDEGLLDQFACPVCYGGLQVAPSGAQIVCLECRRAYPLIDGIPVLIPQRASEGV